MAPGHDLVKPTTVNEVISLLADECESLQAEPDDKRGIVREIVTGALAERPNIHFEAWLMVCMELADRAARREGFDNQVHRAWVLAQRKVNSAKRTARV
jgi:hypothetical protein